jgi:hypothetical protein
MLEIGVVGTIVVLLVEAGKRSWPNAFSPDVVPLWAVAFGALLNAGNAAYFGGDIKTAVAEGIVYGLTAVGAYRTVSSLSKRNSIEFDNIVEMAHQAHEGDEGDGMKKIGGFGK